MADHGLEAVVDTFMQGMHAVCKCGWESERFKSRDLLADAAAASEAHREHATAVREEDGTDAR